SRRSCRARDRRAGTAPLPRLRGRGRARGRGRRPPRTSSAARRSGGRNRPERASGRVTLRVRPLEFEPVAGAGAIRLERAALRLEHAVEEQRLEPDVVVEVLEVAEARHRAAGGDAGARRAAGHVRLQAVDAAVRDQVAEVGGHVRVLAGGDLEARGTTVAEQAQALEVGGADRLLVPDDAPVAGEALSPAERLLPSESAVGI